MAGQTALTVDSLRNLVAELGTDRDKLTYSRFATPFVDDAQIVDAYRGTWLARKVVDIIPDDMTRAWRTWQADKKDIGLLEAAEQRHGLRAKVNMAMRWARLYGGAALVIGAADEQDDLSSPLNVERVSKDGLRYVHMVTRHKLAPGQIDDDIESENFGKPRNFMLHAGHRHEVLHHSRVIPFTGADRPPDVGGVDDGWGDSILIAVWQAAVNATSASSIIASLLYEAKIDIVSVPDLSSHLQTDDGKDRLLRRFSLAGMLKSINNMLLLGDGEEHHQKQINFAGLPDVHIRFLQEAAGAADIPVTRLLGQSPSGLNATGESDMRMFYDMISARQGDDLRPALDRIDELMMRSVFGERPQEIYYEFPSLWQMTPQQQAETNLKNAQAYQIDVNAGVHDDELLRRARSNQIIETGAYPGWETAEEEIEKERKAAGISFDPPERDLTSDAAPRTLYVCRKVKNASEIIKWAKAQGFKTTQPAGDLHVTVAFSRRPIDWITVGESYSGRDGELTINAGGPRIVEPLGDKGAVVLLFASSELSWRHEEMKRAGASWDHDGYQPHITLTYEPGDVDLSKIEPYRGKIVLGPELFAEVAENWEKGIREAAV